MAPRKSRQKVHPAQIPLELSWNHSPDRNFHLGGRSFYFFDFDDNIAYLATPVVLFHKKTHQEILLSSGEFALQSKDIGTRGPYRDYFILYCDRQGTFRYCRDHEISYLDKLRGRRQPFIQDIKSAIEACHSSWKAPSWNCFHYATFNKRPLSIITARGHSPETIQEGIELMVHKGHLPHNPNYLSIIPVNHPQTRETLGGEKSVADLKKEALFVSVKKAVERYGLSNHHRFGMSDDDPKNIELITEAMREMKILYPEMSFYVIQTYQDSFEKREVTAHRTIDLISKNESRSNQLSLFLD